MKKIKLLAPAKINLFLEVLSKRPDNYHNINTLFAKVEVFDKLTLTPQKRKKDINLETINNCKCKLPPKKGNIVMKAAEEFKKEFGFTGGLDIKLEKNIPVGAGLGGGSSDAACTLAGLCKIAHIVSNPLKNKRLLKIAAKIGADVAFFLCKESFSAAKGIGEILSPFKIKKTPIHILIVYPGFQVSTQYIYNNLELPTSKKISTNSASLDTLKEKLKTGSSLKKWKKHLFNRLENVIIPFDKKMNSLYQQLYKLSNGAVLMSGSGSSIFALVEDKQKADYITKTVQTKNNIVFNTHFLGGKQSYGNN